MASQIFHVAAIRRRTKKELDEGTGEDVLILAPTAILAKDKDQAILQAGRILNEDVTDRVEILVRPF